MYREQIRILADAGVDLIAAETMISIEETLAAIDAANSVCSLPILCTVTVEADGSIFSGGNAAEAAAAFESAGADAVGINCSVGPGPAGICRSRHPGGGLRPGCRQTQRRYADDRRLWKRCLQHDSF